MIAPNKIGRSWNTYIIVIPESLVFLRKLLLAFLLHYQASKPTVLLLKLCDPPFQCRNLIRQLFRRLLQLLLTLLLLHAKAGRCSSIATAFVLLCGYPS